MKMAKSIKKVLEGLQDDWKDAEVAEGKKKVPDQEYVAKIQSMEVELSKNSGRPQVKTVFEIVEPEKYEGETVFRFDGLTEQGMPYFKGMAATLGIELPSKIKLLQTALTEFTDEFDGLVEITVSTKDGFTNVFVNGISGEDEDADEDADEDSDEDADEDSDEDADEDADEDSDEDADEDEEVLTKKSKSSKKKS